MVTVTTDQTPFNSVSDPVSAPGMQQYANSVETLFNNGYNGIDPFAQILLNPAINMEIDEGVLEAPTNIRIDVISETSTADDLTTIGASNNRLLVLKAYAGHTIVIRSGQGNITTLDGNDIIMSGNVMLLAFCNGSQWSVVSTGGVKNNFTAGADPTPDDNTLDGYDFGSLWVNYVKDRAYICAAPGSGRWPKISRDVNSMMLRAAAATIQPVGVAAPTITGTPTNVNASDGTFIAMPSGASAGNVGGFVSATFNLLRLNHNPVIEWLVKTDASLTAIRIWIGLTTADQTSSDTAAGSFCGFRYSTVAGDGGGTPSWVAVNRDGSTQSPTPAVIAPIAINTLYKLRLRIVSAAPMAYFSVNDGPEQAFATNLPAITTDLGYLCRPITTAAGAKTLNFSYMKAGW